MKQWLERPGAVVLFEGRPWGGVLWGRRGPAAASLDALAVLPSQRRGGVGSRLLQHFRASLDGAVQSWRFGGGGHHFVPGLPDALAEADGFFAAHGMVADWHAHDLLWEAPQNGSSSWDESTYRLLTANDGAALNALLRHFGGRWQSDTARRLLALEEGCEEEIMGAYWQGRLVGFCHIWSERSRALGPSTFWLRRDRPGWGGVGPLGVHPEQRGLGLGAGVVESSLAYLRRQGTERIGVDWTGLPEFYERCGFRRWLTYRGYHPEG